MPGIEPRRRGHARALHVGDRLPGAPRPDPSWHPTAAGLRVHAADRPEPPGANAPCVWTRTARRSVANHSLRLTPSAGSGLRSDITAMGPQPAAAASSGAEPRRASLGRRRWTPPASASGRRHAPPVRPRCITAHAAGRARPASVERRDAHAGQRAGGVRHLQLTGIATDVRVQRAVRGACFAHCSAVVVRDGVDPAGTNVNRPATPRPTGQR